MEEKYEAVLHQYLTFFLVHYSIYEHGETIYFCNVLFLFLFLPLYVPHTFYELFLMPFVSHVKHRPLRKIRYVECRFIIVDAT